MSETWIEQYYKVEDWPAVWEEIGRAYETPKSRRGSKQRRITEYGLCNALEELNIDSYFLRHIAPLSLRLKSEPATSSFWWPFLYDKHGNRYIDWKPRATFAYLMAAMGHEGFLDLVRFSMKRRER